MADKLPPYRLQPVLEQRERRKQQAERALGEAKQRLRAEQQRLEEMLEVRRQLDAKRIETTRRFEELLTQPGVPIAEESLRHDRYQQVLAEQAARMDAEIAQQRRAVAAAERGVAEAQAALLKAATDLQAMEKHKEKWEEKVRREAREREQEVQEELGQAMWLQQQRRQARG